MSSIKTSDSLLHNQDIATFKRHSKGKLWQALFFFSTLIGVLALGLLLFTIINQSMGYVAIVNKVDPASLSSKPFDQLTKTELIDLLKARLTPNRLKTIEREQPLLERSQIDLNTLVLENIVKPVIVKSYFLGESVLR
ncbi:MAG: hypothetical protein HGA53_06335, partial [Anaerolineaceae bacterium]|nr:hypothetical protein [Anaerolineaceae bacterium]